MLFLGTSLDFKRDSKLFTPAMNLGLSLSLCLLISCIMSSSLVGEGSAKLSNPEKKLKMLSATLRWSSFAEVLESLKT